MFRLMCGHAEIDRVECVGVRESVLCVLARIVRMVIVVCFNGGIKNYRV